MIDQQINYIFDKVRKAVEGPKRGVPFSQKKCVNRAMIQYWKYQVKLLQEKDCNQELMECKHRLAEIEERKVSLDQAEDKLQKAQDIWVDIKQNRKKYRENELMDLYSIKIKEDDPKVMNKRQKVL